MNKERRLGRGLEALLGRTTGNSTSEGANPMSASAVVPSTECIAKLKLTSIQKNPFQPRQEFDEQELQRLCETISDIGMMQPIVVRQVADGYQLIAGERRLRACEMLGWEEVPARLMTADDRQMAEMAIVENMQRKDLNPLEKAAAFQNYLRGYKCSQEELAKRVGIDRSTVANLIRLLELPNPVHQALARERITAGHARALLPLGDETEQIKFCRRIQKEGLTVRKTEEQVRETIETADSEPLGLVGTDAPSPEPRRSEHLTALEQQFRMALGTKVDLRESSRDKGRIIIHFTSQEEFERLRGQLCEQGQPRPQSEAG